MSKFERHRISAGALVERDGKILLVRHRKEGAYDFWVAPGGGVMGNETLAEAAAREVREETGLIVEIGELLFIEEMTQPGVRHCKFWFRARYFSGLTDHTGPLASAEYIVDAKWFSRDEIATLVHVFPPIARDQFWTREEGQPAQYFGVRAMDFF